MTSLVREAVYGKASCAIWCSEAGRVHHENMSALTFYIAKMGYAGLYLFFLFLLQNIDCGSRRGGTNVVRHSMFLAKIFKICITHGQVFVM